MGIIINFDLNMLENIKLTANFIAEKTRFNAEVGIILGTGLGGLVSEIDIVTSIPYDDIPNFPVSTVDGHHGRLILGHLGNKKVMAMQGRFHFYEGYSMEEVTFPVRVMQQLGIKYLFVSNATGGLNPDYVVGDIMVINDHINFFPEHPLRGPNIAVLGPRFPDMSRVYDERLRYAARLISLENSLNLKEGVYVGVSGPTFETPAEYLMFRRLGGDVVGMSTVPEVIVARHAGMRVFGISIITDSGVPGQIVEISHEEVQKVAMKAEPKMTLVLKKLIESIA
jgi:purine-nucleoside phosphorylase